MKIGFSVFSGLIPLMTINFPAVCIQFSGGIFSHRMLMFPFALLHFLSSVVGG
jgi:hypothetical protein